MKTMFFKTVDATSNSHTQLYVIQVLLCKIHAAKLMNAIHKEQLPPSY